MEDQDFDENRDYLSAVFLHPRGDLPGDTLPILDNAIERGQGVLPGISAQSIRPDWSS